MKEGVDAKGARAGQDANRIYVAAIALTLVLVASGPLTAQISQGSPPVSTELRAMYEADQSDRRGLRNPTPEDWERIARRDSIRRARVLDVIREGALTSAEDHYHAAIILQHGRTAEDALVAHILATVAAFEGDQRGRWLSAAALDRYLHRIDKAQWLGTQYVRGHPRRIHPDSAWTQEPYVRWLPDSIRRAFSVDSLAGQEEYVNQLNGGDE